MSGICGICNAPGSSTEPRLASMLASLAQPGELGTDFVVAKSARLGVATHWDFQRACGQDGLLIAADAEIFNKKELVSLLGLGNFASANPSSAELVAALYRKYGTDFVKQLEGAFSIAIWDEQNRRLVLVTDGLGISALYWKLENNTLLFASRSGAVRAGMQTETDVNSDAVMQYLIFSVVSAPLSIYKGIDRLPPGQLLVWENGKIVKTQFWDVEYADGRWNSPDECAAAVRDGIRSAVFRTANDLDPSVVGAYLSGGTDSSSVVAFLNEWHAPAKSFTIFFDEGQYSEIEFARTTARHFKVQHFEQCLRPQDAFEIVTRLNRYYDEPFANSSAIGGYYCARMAKENGVTTLLAGDGGDELFGGNERYATDKRFSLYHTIPKGLRTAIVEPLVALLGASEGKLGLPGKYIRRANIPNPRRIYSYGLFLTEAPEGIFEPAFLEHSPPQEWMDIAQGHFDKGENRSELNRILYMDLKMTLADNDLRKVMGTAEMAGVRARFPLLDRQLVELSAKIPAKWKLKGFEKRFIFKQAMKGILPTKILKKKKHGFGVPVSLWLLEDRRLESLMNDVMSDAKTRQRGIFQPQFIDSVLKKHRSEDRKNFGELIWYMLMLELWHREHFERKREPAFAD